MVVQDRAARHTALVVGLALAGVYLATGASMLTFWDAGEFATAIGTFGIPHPPGTPLYVALGAALWHLLPVLTPVQAGSLLSALATAGACGVAAALVTRVAGHRVAGAAAGLSAGAMGTVWLNATETEVYAVALLSVALQCALAWRAHTRDDDRARVLLAYLAALSMPLHLSALVATPATMLLASTAPDGTLRWRPLVAGGALVASTALLCQGQAVLSGGVLFCAALWVRVARHTSTAWVPAAAGATLLAWTAVAIMLVRARQAPFLNQGDPDTLRALYDVVIRAQYDVAGPWPRRAPFWLQLGNIGQYADWQVALGAWNDVTPSWWRTPFSVLAALLGVVGARAHWRVHRPTARAATALLLLATVGVCVTLNLRAGPSFGFGILDDGAVREARERDYFFALAFWLWGLWMGVGAFALAAARQRARVALLVPIAVLAGNWRAVTRDAMPDRRMATVIADGMLLDVPRDGLLFTAGDNDSYPLWYRQAVDGVRPDVQVVVTSLLPANWYLTESASRAGGWPPDTVTFRTPLGRAAQLAGRQLDRRRSVAVSLLLSPAERSELGRIAGVTCWTRVGLVDIGTRGLNCPPRIDVERVVASATRMQPVLMDAVRQSPDGMVAAFQRVARCPRAASLLALQRVSPSDTSLRKLLDITCNLR